MQKSVQMKYWLWSWWLYAVPLVREQVGAFFGQEPLTSIDPDQVVALGAAAKQISLLEISPIMRCCY